ncbi:serine protease [Ideonella sp. B508-1]|uniref:CrpP-related protein n=1 Tax=Ideonella sp. B508-1 TaxID=137716 RepID=UPI001F2F2790|nr:serine protease [Ideonella sp. B508-1]
MPSSQSDPPFDDEGMAPAKGVPSSSQHSPALFADNGEYAELERQGAKAAVRGEDMASNPMRNSVNQPEATGESLQRWADRRDAWDHGYRSQLTPAGPPAPTSCDGRVQDEALFGVTRVLTFQGRNSLSSASGFFFERDGRLFLITSRHVLFDAPSRHTPDRIEIEIHTDPGDLTSLSTLSILLHRGGLAAWHQARDGGGDIDVAALEIDRSALPADGVLRAFGVTHLTAGFDMFEVGDSLAIPGFPLGFFDTVHHLPVVRQASIASCYGVRFQGQGFFLTDARMHRGSSGSPVLARTGAVRGAGRPRWFLLGVHSSRMDMATRDITQDESLGLNCAWYADILLTLTDREDGRLADERDGADKSP